MKIAIDARLIEETGIGRYTGKLIANLGKIDRDNRYVVLLRQKSYAKFGLPNRRWEKRLAEVPWHSLREQFLMPWLLVKEHVDLVHIPYHNIPIFYPGKFVVTMHDLTILHFDTGRATTLPSPLYKGRRLGYYVGLAVGLRRSVHILAVSQATKAELVNHFGVPPDKISVTYEGADNLMQNSKSKIHNEARTIESPYLLYVGNAYPHKNLELLINAFATFVAENPRLAAGLKLVLVGKDDFFYQRLTQFIQTTRVANRIKLFGPADEPTLAKLYRSALALVFPSLMEGFGLPAVEALSYGCPVICSDIPVFHEVLDSVPVFFNPSSSRELVGALVGVISDNRSFRERVEQAQGFLRRYRWEKMARETLEVYRQAGLA